MPPYDAALHEQAALSRSDADEDALCVDFSDCDSEEDELQEPSMAPENPVEPSSALCEEAPGSSADEFLFDFDLS